MKELLFVISRKNFKNTGFIVCILISLNSDTIQHLRTFTVTGYKIRRFEIPSFLFSFLRSCKWTPNF